MKLAATLMVLLWWGMSHAASPPNVVLIITDDQGFGDLGIHGNPHIATPNLDAFARESVALLNFNVSPVCAPTRSSLLTGRYSLRTGIRDTYNGGSFMSTDEVTIAELLRPAGYVTGAFGKWHLGDNYPGRPVDQGFDESVVHLAGGIGQVGDFLNWPAGDRSYFDPTLWHNGQMKAYSGYCSDIFTTEAVRFMRANKDRPFFCYLAFNAPHTPLQVPEAYYERYRHMDPSSGLVESEKPTREMNDRDRENARRVYAMVTNIDDNVGRVLQTLEELGLKEDTLVVFMSDNGPQHARYNGGMRGLKSSVYQGGIQVPFYWRYPALGSETEQVHTPLAHIDLLPSLAELCGVPLPLDRVIDGRSFLPLLKGEDVDWGTRSLFHYWTRRYPILYDNMAVQRGRFKLVAKAGRDARLPDFELYDLESDPGERENLIEAYPDTATSLKREMEQMYGALIASPNLVDPPLIHAGTAHENPVFLNRNDAGGERRIGSREEGFGKWRVRIESGRYNLRFKFLSPLPSGGTLYLEAGTRLLQLRNSNENLRELEMNDVWLSASEGDLIPMYQVGSKQLLPFLVVLERIDL